MLNLYQGGFGLPDESYYSDEQHAAMLARVRASSCRACSRWPAWPTGRPLARTRIVDLESRAGRRALGSGQVPGQLADLQPEGPGRARRAAAGRLWDAWLAGLGADPPLLERVIVRQPDYFTALAALLTADRLPAWKEWLTWQIVRSAAPLGPADLGGEELRLLRAHAVRDAAAARAVEARCAFVEMAAGEALGRLYVERHFPPAAKQRMDELVANLLEAYRRNISELPWMSEETQARALDKLDAFTPKIGYPDRWRDYRALAVAPTTWSATPAGPPRSSWTGNWPRSAGRSTATSGSCRRRPSTPTTTPG